MSAKGPRVMNARWRRDLDKIEETLADEDQCAKFELFLSRAEHSEGDAPPCLRELAELCRRVGERES